MTLREQGSTSGHGIQIMTKSVTESKEVLTFIHEARRFCRYVSRIEKRSIRVTSQDLLQILLSLCHRALQLPDIERSPFVDHPFRFSISERRRRRLARYFGKYDVYQEKFDPYERDDTEVITETLSDHWESVYDDIGRGIKGWDRASVHIKRDRLEMEVLLRTALAAPRPSSDSRIPFPTLLP